MNTKTLLLIAGGAVAAYVISKKATGTASAAPATKGGTTASFLNPKGSSATTKPSSSSLSGDIGNYATSFNKLTTSLSGLSDFFGTGSSDFNTSGFSPNFDPNYEFGTDVPYTPPPDTTQPPDSGQYVF